MKREHYAVAALFAFAIVFAPLISYGAINDRHETACPIPAVEQWRVHRRIFERGQAETKDRKNLVWETRYDPFRANYIGVTVSLDETVIAKMWNIEVRENHLIFADVRTALFAPDLSVWKNEIRIPTYCGGWYLGKKGVRLGRRDAHDIFGWRKEGVALSLETESGTVITQTIKTN